MTRESPSHDSRLIESSELVNASDDSMTRVIKILNESDDSVTRVIKLLTSHERLDDSSSRVRDL